MSNDFFSIIAPDVEKYGTARQTKIQRMRFLCWIFDKQGYVHTQNMYYVLLFHSNKVTRTRLRVTLHVHCCLVRFYQRCTRL